MRKERDTKIEIIRLEKKVRKESEKGKWEKKVRKKCEKREGYKKRK